MLCPFYPSIANGRCDQANNKLVCFYDGGDCHNIDKCTTIDCIEDKKFDPCPNHHLIGDGHCDEENNNFICSFDGRDCKTRYDCQLGCLKLHVFVS